MYEDWYFVDGSAALDRLDEAAVAAAAVDSHTGIARLSATGAGGLYRLRSGAPLPAPSRCTWITKPREQTYKSFLLDVKGSGTVWSRQMVLGPTPEFCIEGDDVRAGVVDPVELRPTVIQRLR